MLFALGLVGKIRNSMEKCWCTDCTARFSSGSPCGMKILVANVEEIPRVTVQWESIRWCFFCCCLFLGANFRSNKFIPWKQPLPRMQIWGVQCWRLQVHAATALELLICLASCSSLASRSRVLETWHVTRKFRSSSKETLAGSKPQGPPVEAWQFEHVWTSCPAGTCSNSWVNVDVKVFWKKGPCCDSVLSAFSMTGFRFCVLDGSASFVDMTDTAKFDLRLMIFHGSSFDTDERMKRAGAPGAWRALIHWQHCEWKNDAELHQGLWEEHRERRSFKNIKAYLRQISRSPGRNKKVLRDARDSLALINSEDSETCQS